MIFIIMMILILVVAAIFDVRSKSIAMPLLIVTGVVSLVCGICQLFYGAAVRAELLSLIPGVFTLAASYVTKEQIGYGDGLMILFLGPVFGLVNVVLGCCTALLLSMVFSGAMLILRKAGRETRLPFLPFLAAGMGGICVLQFI